MEKNNNGCVNAYLNLSIRSNGSVSPCCMSNYKYTSKKGETTLNQDSIINFWNSESRKKFIEQMDAGIKIPECHACWNEEAAGKDSKRIRDNRTFKDALLSPDMLPVVLDLSMGNVCNIKCRICNPAHSTPWKAEEEKVKFIINKIDFTSFKESFEYSNDFFWKDIVSLLPNVVKYDFAGGEPFFIEKHWDIVKTAVDNGWSKNQHIHYNTNGTIYPEKYMHLLEEFKIVDIQISSDGIEEQFEYMRHPAKWKKVEENIQRFVDAKNNSKTEWWLSTCISISAFNVYYFFETFEHYASKGIGIYVNIVHDYRGSRIIPTELKNKIIAKLKSKKSQFSPQQWERERDMICSHLENTSYDESSWNSFWKEINVRDKYRNENFQQSFPEYNQIANPFIK